MSKYFLGEVAFKMLFSEKLVFFGNLFQVKNLWLSHSHIMSNKKGLKIANYGKFMRK